MFPIFELSYTDLNGSDCIHSMVCRSKVGISLITTPRLSRRVKSNPVGATGGSVRGSGIFPDAHHFSDPFTVDPLNIFATSRKKTVGKIF